MVVYSNLLQLFDPRWFNNLIDIELMIQGRHRMDGESTTATTAGTVKGGRSEEGKGTRKNAHDNGLS